MVASLVHGQIGIMLRMIERGMNKYQLYNLIGRPHFSEGLFGVEEWDYVFNYRENGVHKICHIQSIIVDKNQCSKFLLVSNGCNGNSSFALSGDFLFDFDKDTLTARVKKLLTVWLRN